MLSNIHQFLNKSIPSYRTAAMVLFFLGPLGLFSQTDIYEIMSRDDLPLNNIEKLANDYFLVHGTGQGSGYKQYQRWLYERRFHLTDEGYKISSEQEDLAYYDAVRNMGVMSRSGFEWKELGPKSWNHTSSWNPGVGRITSVAVNPQDASVIYVCSPGGGIWKSNDSGSTWSPLLEFVNSSWMDVYYVCIDPQNPDVVYAGLSSGGVIKSSNAGASWSATGSGPTTSRKIRIHPNNSSIVFVAGSNGLWRSVNAGSTWTKVESSTKEDIEFHPTDPNIMYASGSGGPSYVWRSIDNGLTWTGIDSAAGMYRGGRTLIAAAPSNPAIVYVLQAKGSVFGRFYKSTDTGKTFTTMIVGDATKKTAFFGYSPDGTDTKGQANHDMALVVNPSDENMIHIAGILCWRSDDGGVSFSATTNWTYPNVVGYNHADVHALEMVNGVLYSGSDGGVYKSLNDGDDWLDLSSGLGVKMFYRIACSITDENVVTGGAQDNGSSYRKSDGTWVDWLGADGMDCVISPTDANVVIGTSQNGSIYRTVNGGDSYQGLNKPSNGNWVTPLVMHPYDQDTVWGGWTGIFRSDDGGDNWLQIATGISVTLDNLVVAPSNTRFIYASKGSTLYRITNGGANYSAVAAPASITSIFVSKKDPLNIWITCSSSSNRVFVSYDGGTNFTNISAGLPSMAARSVVVDEDTVQTIYVGMNIGVYYRDNQNNVWAEHAVGLPLVAINEVEIQKSSNKLRVATYGRGVWESFLRNVDIQCKKPSGLTAYKVTSNRAIISWTKPSDASSFRIEYKKAGDTIWTVWKDSTTSNTDTLTGLTPEIKYFWKVISRCKMGSSQQDSANFTTGLAGSNALAAFRPYLNLYPDPANEKLTVDIFVNASTQSELRIFDATGRAVWGTRKSFVAGSNPFDLNLDTLQTGNYTLQILTPDFSESVRFMINR